jgi:hypothetical protein
MKTHTNYFKHVVLVFALLFSSAIQSKAQDSQGWKQLQHIGGSGSDFTYAITTDSQQRLIVTSNAYSELSFPGTTLPNGGNGDGVVVRYATDGSFEWASHTSGSGDEIIYDVATDHDGNVYIAGKFTGTTQFGSTYTGISSGGSDLFVAKLDQTGAWMWVRTIGGENNDFARGITVDPQGRVTISGQVSGELTIDGDAVKTTNNSDILFAQWDASGTLQWYKMTGGSSETYPYKVVSDKDGNLYAAGQFNNTVTFDSQEMTSSGYYDVYILKMDAAGSVIWTQQSKGYYSEQAYDLAVNDNGQVFITGYFSDKADFGSTQVDSRGADDIYLAKLDADGSYLWATSGGGTGWDYARSVTLNRRGNPVITGDFGGIAHFGNEKIEASGGDFDTDAFMVEYGPNGEVLKAQSVGGANSNFGYSIASDASGNIYLGGVFFSKLTLGENTIQGSGENDVFVGKYGFGNLDLISETKLRMNEDTVAVQLQVKDAYNLYYYELSLDYDTKYLEYVGAEADSLFDGNALFIAGKNDDNTVGISAGRTDQGLYGSGDAFTIYFTIKRYQDVKTKLTFPKVTAYDQNMKQIKTNPLADVTVDIVKPFLVWPGDADNDGVVNEVDVLALSRYWANQGTTRSDQTINWEAKRATPWADTAATFADTDGDGVVNQADLRAITFNYGKEQSQEQPLSSDTDETLMATNLTAAQGDTVSIVIKATDYFEVKGLSTRIAIENVPTGSYEILNVEAGSWFDLWKNSNESIEFSRIQNNEAVIATAGKGGPQDVLVNKNEVLFTLTLRATQQWQDQARVAVKNFSAVAEEGSVYSAGGQATIESSESAPLNPSETPKTTQLNGNYPNPFNPSTQISFSLENSGFVTLKIFNMLGQEVATLVNQPMQKGTHKVSFNASELSSGMYMYRLIADNYVDTKKMMLVK